MRRARMKGRRMLFFKSSKKGNRRKNTGGVYERSRSITHLSSSEKKMKTLRTFSILGLCMIAVAIPAAAQTLQESLWSTNGNVYAVAYRASSNTLYIGGNFTYVGPTMGNGAAITRADGATVAGMPKVTGNVRVVVPDGSGGWYIGGDFTMVGGLVRNRLAHIKSDKSVDTGWDPNVSDYVSGSVNTIAVDGTTVYVGGDFDAIGGLERYNIAAIDANSSSGTYGQATAWNPPDPSSDVCALAVSGDHNTVYVGGYFSNFGGLGKYGIVALNASTAVLNTGWGDADGTVFSLAVSGTTVYAGGAFTTIGGLTRYGIAALGPDGIAIAGFDAQTVSASYPTVTTMAISGSTLYVGGGFSAAAFGGSTRKALAALDKTTGTVTAWNPIPSDAVNTIAVSGDGATVYVGGEFGSIGYVSSGDQPIRNKIAPLNASDGVATSWNPDLNPNGNVYALAVDGTNLYFGGNFTGIRGVTRNNVAALDVSTGSATSWDPNSAGTVRAIAISGSTVYAGGSFNGLGGESRNNIAALNIDGNGTPEHPYATTWNPNADNTVYALAVSGDGNIVYAGGGFSNIGVKSRNNIAAISTSDGIAVDTWNPDASNSSGSCHVYALALSGDGKVYAGGSFTTIGGSPRNNIAALNASDGIATAWNPSAVHTDGGANISALALSGDGKVYAGGYFTTIGGMSRNNIAALNTDGDGTEGHPYTTTWNPTGDGYINCLALSGTTLYTGGYFATIGGRSRNNIAALGTTDGLATSWNPNAGIDDINAIAVSNTAVFAGGQFTSICSSGRSYIAAMNDPYNSALPVELTSFTAAIERGNVVLNWKTATEVNSAGFEIQRTPSPALPLKGGERWLRVGFVEGHGTTNAPQSYSFTDKQAAGKYQYRLKQIDRDGKFEYSQTIEADLAAPVTFGLDQNYPNPFNPTTNISFTLPVTGQARLTIFNVLGAEVGELFNGIAKAGEKQTAVFDAGKFASGVYFYRLEGAGKTDIKKMQLIR